MQHGVPLTFLLAGSAFRLERDDFSSNHHPALIFCLSMIFVRKSPHPSLPRKRGRDKGWGVRNHALILLRPDEALLRLDELYVGRALECARERFTWVSRTADCAKPVFQARGRDQP